MPTQFCGPGHRDDQCLQRCRGRSGGEAEDILRRFERVRIALRNKDSNIVTGVVNLRYGVDYDINYLQGRVLLSEPLTSTAAHSLLVRSSRLSGDQANLVVRYR